MGGSVLTRLPTERAALLEGLLGATGRLHIVSNRGPLQLSRDDGPEGLVARRGSGGLVTALAELGRHAPVTWVAAADTAEDVRAAPILARPDRARRASSDGDGRFERTVRAVLERAMPGQDIRIHLVELPPEVYEGYYEVVSNPFLWFLQHQMYALPFGPNVDTTLLSAWRGGYRPANRALAEATVAATGRAERPIVMLQDYHLYLAAPVIREAVPEATILHFIHVPWPPDSVWQVVPQGIRRAICEGLLACDIVGLQTDRYASHFLDTVASFVRDARVDPAGRSVRWRGRTIRVRTYPISVDPEGLARFAGSPEVEAHLERLRERMARAGNPTLIVRADRIEPSKNALRGFLAFEALLQARPELRQSVRFVAVQAPTRTTIPEYVDYAAAVREVVARVNGLADPEDQPIWIYDGTDYGMAIAALRAARVVLVNPVVDGMNLVVKEAILVGEQQPAIILSETAGAAEQLAADCLTVAPADIVGTRDQMERALEMPIEERRGRLRRLRASVRAEDVRWWLDRQLRDIGAVRRGAMPPSRRMRDAVRRIEPPWPE
jgi:trehalose 6-phosphate synthase